MYTNYLGRHFLIELYNCDQVILNSCEQLEKVMNHAAEISGATIVKSVFHKFSPYGVSGVVVVQESHFAIHTWPEHDYAAIDIFTCSDQMNHEAGYDFLWKNLKSKNHNIKEVKRGIDFKSKPKEKTEA